MFEAVTLAQRSAELFCARYCCFDSSKATVTCAQASPSHPSAPAAAAGMGVGVSANAPDCTGIIISVVKASNAADPAAAILGLTRPCFLVIISPLILIFEFLPSGGRAVEAAPLT